VSIDAPVLTSYHAENNITYCSPGGEPQHLNLYIPDNRDRSLPLLVYVHGGGWYTGSKDTATIAEYVPEVARLGYVVASVDYRLAPAHTFPAQIQDTKCAIRFLRAHARQYNIDPARVGMIGESAGGYLAAFAGATGDDARYKTAEYRNQSDAVQAVVDLFGPSTFTAVEARADAARMAQRFLGSASRTEASIAPHISSAAPPMLLVHGQEDTLVPFNQSQLLYDALRRAGRPVTFIPVANAGHGLQATPNTIIQPSLPALRGRITEFLAQNLK
jgi:acetyl esterase/lipase